MRDSSSGGNFNSCVYTTTARLTWFRLKPLLNSSQTFSGTAVNTSNRANTYDFFGKDILTPVFVEQNTTAAGNTALNLVGEARGM